MDAPTPDEAGKLLEVINSLRFDVMAFIAFMTCVIIGYLLVTRYIAGKRAAAAEAAKIVRADSYTQSMNNLAVSLYKHTEQEDLNSKQTNAALDRLASSIGVLVQRTNGQMDRNVSLRMMRMHLTETLAQQVIAIADRSLTANNYASRETYIANKVRTVIGATLFDMREQLRSFPLAFDPDLFFETYPDQGERFVLCDRLWATIEPYYSEHSNLRDRIEECALGIENVIKDHFATTAASIVPLDAHEVSAVRAATTTRTRMRQLVEEQSARMVTPRPG